MVETKYGEICNIIWKSKQSSISRFKNRFLEPSHKVTNGRACYHT